MAEAGVAARPERAAQAVTVASELVAAVVEVVSLVVLVVEVVEAKSL